jgi:hypothetical protein
MIHYALSASIFLLSILLHIPASADWTKEWEKTREGAKKEGQGEHLSVQHLLRDEPL